MLSQKTLEKIIHESNNGGVKNNHPELSIRPTRSSVRWMTHASGIRQFAQPPPSAACGRSATLPVLGSLTQRASGLAAPVASCHCNRSKSPWSWLPTLHRTHSARLHHTMPATPQKTFSWTHVRSKTRSLHCRCDVPLQFGPCT